MSPTIKKITTPLSDEVIKSLNVGDVVHITGIIYTARDAAHKQLVELAEKGEPMPFDFSGQIIYYAGPCPNKSGHVIGPIGPTTSGRMDAYTPTLAELGLKAIIGKGLRNDEVKRAIVKHCGVYFAAVGGAAALIAQCVKSVEVIAFPELGTEAIRRLEVVDLPVVVAIDSRGRDIYQV